MPEIPFSDLKCRVDTTIHRKRSPSVPSVTRGLIIGIDPAEKIISLPCGTYIRDLKKSFHGALEAAGFVYNHAHERHALTSLRHTYATTSLTKPADKRPTLHVLALQIGTSERMINQHYGHDSVLDYRAELRG